ncbi:MAG: hypothetical protein IJT66_04330 [Clostridia bacterium]|nr:hypothetical protein [Clostridia bacterium]
MEEKTVQRPPEIESRLRHIIRIPQEARECSGIYIFGRRIKTLVFITDIAIIRNCGANAVTFTPPSAKILFSELMSKYRE